MKKLDLYPKIDWKQYSPGPVIGVDEVGRGCLAGPVYAAAVSLDNDLISNVLTDSKLLSEKRREELAEVIKAHHRWSLGFASVEEIDQLNILNAALLAMRRAVEGLGLSSGHVLVDGNKKIPGLSPQWLQTTIVKGDLRVAPISAASIIAKVARDHLMKELGREYPAYGFEIHKGYSTAQHKGAIESVGPCIIHRRTFSGVKEYLR